MKFSQQIKKIRTDNSLTQEQLAEKLHVSRQTVSSWENSRNLPDLEMVVKIAKTFSLSLDQLILGGDKMADKLIKDSSETRRARFNMITAIVGGVLLIIGAASLILKGFTVEYVDSSGMLHENFFLIPVGLTFIFGSVITFFTLGIKTLIEKIKNRKSEK